MKPSVIIGAALACAAGLFLLLVPHWTLPPILSTDYGPPEGEMVVFKDSRAKPQAMQPELIPAAAAATPGPAGASYANLHVLKGLSDAEVNRTMLAMTQWVAPKQGCGFCHAGNDYAAETPRLKIARRMLTMVRTVNANWTDHVGARGVTCYTCHRGNNLPDSRWYLDTPRTPPEGGILGKPQPWDSDAKTIREFFPNRPFRMFLLEGLPAHNVQSRNALATSGDAKNFEHDRDYAEQVYILMMQMSNGLGVNCTYCHQSRAAFDWSQSPPTRLHGYSGIKMTAMLNQNFLAPLAPWTDHALLGKMGDAPKVDCKSCHNGQEKPEGGMLNAFYPGLIGPIPTGPANPVAAANPTIPQLARAPRVGQPATDTLVEFKGVPQG
jgi:photosynthetic reaction center cytochrome c subunit